MNGQRKRTAIVIGAGVGGLSAGLRLIADGWDVTILERASAPGGKLRTVQFAGGPRIDAGPTVFTMRWIFDRLFSSLGESIEDHMTFHQAEILARHGWQDGSRLDLFADRERSAEAIAAFAGGDEARGYLEFCDESESIFKLLKDPFLARPIPSVANLISAFGLSPLQAMRKMQPFNTMWRGISKHFQDPRLRQLFGRYATYCGSSPYLAPATLMLVAHVEQDGVWYLDGGMYALIETLEKLIKERGGIIRCDSHVSKINRQSGRVSGVTLESGQELQSDVVIMNGDTNAVASGQLGPSLRSAVKPTKPVMRSLSAMTWMMEAEVSNFPLVRHNVFFSNDYQREFDEIFSQGRLPTEPTVYICAQDRNDVGSVKGAERLFFIVNAPAKGGTGHFSDDELSRCEESTFRVLKNCGVDVRPLPEKSIRFGPDDFSDLFPATGGAIYGPASHGWQASLKRPGCRSKIAGLYFAGGSTHPGPGVPMAALSGLMAAECAEADS